MNVLLVKLVFALSLDGGMPPPGPVVRPEDVEVVNNLELLENLESSADLELLQELSLER